MKRLALFVLPLAASLPALGGDTSSAKAPVLASPQAPAIKAPAPKQAAPVVKQAHQQQVRQQQQHRQHQQHRQQQHHQHQRHQQHHQHQHQVNGGVPAVVVPAVPVYRVNVPVTRSVIRPFGYSGANGNPFSGVLGYDYGGPYSRSWSFYYRDNLGRDGWGGDYDPFGRYYNYDTGYGGVGAGRY